MAQTGYTPILIYSSSTAAAAPAAGSLTNSTLGSELAINITDGKLFYKDNANAVQVIGWKTVPTTAGGTGLTSYTAGDLIYYASGTTFTKLAIGSAYQALQVNAGGTAPSWQPSASSVLTAQGDLLYASAANTLARLAKSTTATRYLANTGTTNNPQWDQVNLANGVTGTLPIANGGTNATATPTAGGVSYGTGSAYAFTAAGTTNYLLQSAGSSAPTWSNSINGITIGASTAAAGTFTTLTASLSQISTTSNYHQIKTGGINQGGGVQDSAAILEGTWYIDTTNTDIAPIAIKSGDKWRLIFIGAWANYFEGFGVNGPGNYCEITSDSNTIAVGSRTVTVTRNGTTGYLQWSSGATYASVFQGTIILSQSNGAPSYAFNVKGGMLAVGVYSTTVGATNRDVFVDNTGVIGYVSSTRESKMNIQSLDDVSWLLRLDPVQFNRRKKKPVYGPDNDRLPIGEAYSDETYEELEYGLIADDAENVNNELCFYDVDENGQKILRGVHYSKLIAPVLKLAQKQQTEIEALKSELAAIKAGGAS